MSPRTMKVSSVLSSSVSLGGGTVDRDGVVQLQNELNDITKPSPMGIFKPSLQRYETGETAATETNSSLDSASIRDGDLDAFIAEDPSMFTDSEFGTNAELLQALEEAVELEKHVLTARYLKEMDRRNLKLPDPKRQAALKKTTEQIQEILEGHAQCPAEGGWKKQGMLHGKHRDTMVYHRTNDKGEMTVRLETPIPASLVSPLLAILNETDLYTTWLPSFQRPFKLGVTSTGKLKQCSRASQVAFAKVDMPWPMHNREVIVRNLFSESVDENGCIVVRAKSMEAGEEEEGLTIPPVEAGWDRIKLDAGLLLRKCPNDHPALKRHNAKKNRKFGMNSSSRRRSSVRRGEKEEPMLLATFTLFVTPSINMVLKVVAGPMWSALVQFAEDVKKGKKGAQHKARIAATPELYGWVDSTVERMTEKCS